VFPRIEFDTAFVHEPQEKLVDKSLCFLVHDVPLCGLGMPVSTLDFKDKCLMLELVHVKAEELLSQSVCFVQETVTLTVLDVQFVHEPSHVLVDELSRTYGGEESLVLWTIGHGVLPTRSRRVSWAMWQAQVQAPVSLQAWPWEHEACALPVPIPTPVVLHRRQPVPT
jgi:hypothetical protein